MEVNSTTLYDTFRLFSTFGSGSESGRQEQIRTEDLPLVLKAMDLGPEVIAFPEVQEMERAMDPIGSGFVDFESFERVVARCFSATANSAEEQWRVFRMFDVDHKGYVSLTDISRVAQVDCHGLLSEDQCRFIMQQLRSANRGGLSFEDWKRSLKNTNVLAFTKRTAQLQRQLAKEAKNLPPKTKRPALEPTVANSASNVLFAQLLSTEDEIVVTRKQPNTASILLRREFRCHTESIQGIAWSPNNRELVTVGDDKNVFLWDVSGKKSNVSAFQGHTAAVNVVAWHPIESRIATGSHDANVRLWDTVKRECLLTFEGHRSAVTCLAWSPDGSCIASGGLDSTVLVWIPPSSGDTAVGQPVVLRRADSDAVKALAWATDDSQRLAVGTGDGRIALWTPSDGKLVGALDGHDMAITALVWTPDAKLIASGSADGGIRVWDVASSKLVADFKAHVNTVHALSWHRNLDFLASAGWDGVVNLWSLGSILSSPAAPAPLLALEYHKGPVCALNWSRDGTKFASGGADSCLVVCDLGTGTIESKVTIRNEYPISVAFTIDESRVLVTFPEMGQVRYDIKTGEQV